MIRAFLPVCVLAAFTLSLTWAQTPAKDQGTLIPPVRPFRLPARIGVFTEAQISLDQALAMALKNNKDVEASRIDQQEAEYNLIGARGAFDPLVGTTGFWEKQVTPAASSLSGSASGALLNRMWQADPVVSGFTP